jgi:hypothetical protein
MASAAPVFKKNPDLFGDIAWRSPIENVTQICQKICKIRIKIRLRFSVKYA